MAFKNTPALQTLVSVSELTQEAFTEKLIQELSERGICPTDEESFGMEIREVYNYPVTLKEFIEIMDILSIPKRSDYLTMLVGLTFFGSGDCPNCGGDLETDESKTQWKHVFGDGINDEPEHEPVFEVINCKVCEYNETHNYEHTE